MSLISLLIALLIIAVVLWAARAILGVAGLGQPVTTIVYVIIVLLALLWFVQSVGLLGGSPSLRIS